jgi:hypothetical protein
MYSNVSYMLNKYSLINSIKSKHLPILATGSTNKYVLIKSHSL